MSCSFLPAQKNIPKEILVSLCFMLHPTILKQQQQKEKTKHTEGGNSLRAQSHHKSKFRIGQSSFISRGKTY